MVTNYLHVDKTRERVIDIRKKGDVRANYLGTGLDNKLTFECNTNHIVKKCHQRLFCTFIEIFRCESYDSVYVLL